MNFTHDLVTDEIKDEIRKSVKEKSLTPGHVLVEYENDPPSLLRWNDYFADQKPEKKCVRFAAFRIKEDQAEKYLTWFSGVIFGLVGA